MVKKIEMQWSYTPEDILNESYNYIENHFELKIKEGKAIILFEHPDFCLDDINDEMINRYKSYVSKAIKSIEFIKKRLISIGGLVIKQIHEDGSEDTKVFVKSLGGSISSTFTANLIIRDSDGNIIENTRDERINQRNNFIDRVLDNGVFNNRLQQLLNSYSNSLDDPDNEFFYLYEIRDGLSVTFEGKYDAISKLNITENDWRELGRITNVEPYKEGRHRGDHLDEELIPAPANEKKIAREIAIKMIKAYIEFISNEE